jgi:hypothetical protein
LSEYDGQLSELGEAARRAGEIVLEQIDAMVGAAENRAGEIREGAELHAEGKHRETMESARRVFERLEALERPLGELAMTLREEKERFAGELRQGAHAAQLPAGVEVMRAPS